MRLKEDIRFSWHANDFRRQNYISFKTVRHGPAWNTLVPTERELQGVWIDILFSSVFFPFVCLKVKPSWSMVGIGESVIPSFLMIFWAASPQANEASLTMGLLSCKLSTHRSRANCALKTLTNAFSCSWLLSSKESQGPLGGMMALHQGTWALQEVDGVLPASTWEDAASVFPFQANELHSLHLNILQARFS